MSSGFQHALLKLERCFEVESWIFDIFPSYGEGLCSEKLNIDRSLLDPPRGGNGERDLSVDDGIVRGTFRRIRRLQEGEEVSWT
jgi:hypothetical protein